MALFIWRWAGAAKRRWSHPTKLLIPIGDATTVDEVRVYWLEGETEIWTKLPVEEMNYLIEGTGQTRPSR